MTTTEVANFLAAALQKQTEERRDFLICSPDDAPDYYVQFPHPGEDPTVLYAEAVSDAFLQPDLAIGAEGAAALSGLGWNPPTTTATRSRTGSPSWYREFELDDDNCYHTIAATLLETLRGVYGYAAGRLRIKLGPRDGSPGLISIFDPTSATAGEWSLAEEPSPAEEPSSAEEPSLPEAPRHHFTAEELQRPAPSSYEWFRSLADVPGVGWDAPPEAGADARLASAKPIPDPDGYSRTGVAWVCEDGTLVADGTSRDTSPADLALRGIYEVVPDVGLVRQAAADVIRTVLTALGLPGTRHDFHSALRRLARTEGVEPGLRERTLLADVQLVMDDPVEALNDPRYRDFREPSVREAGSPIVDLMHLYVSEGFLADAQRAEAMLDALREEARPDSVYGRASQVIEDLRLLRE